MDKQQHKKENAIAILASSVTYAEAARLLEVNPCTIYEWLKDPEYVEKLEQTRNLIVGDAIGKLKGYCVRAVDTLASLLDDESSQVRRGAANDILNHVSRYKEIEEFEKRISNLERISNDKR
jgi:hypothetical protein